eukprot:234290_1
MAFNSQSSISDKRRSNSESSSPSLASKLSFTSSSLSSSYVHLATRRRNLGPAIMTRNNSVFAIVFISLACVLYFNYYIMNNHHTVTTVEYQEPLNYSHLQNTGLSEFAPREIYISVDRCIPYGFPWKPEDFDVNNICSDIKDCDINNCKHCIPPSDAFDAQINEKVIEWQQHFHNTAIKRREKLQSMLSNITVVIAMVVNYDYLWLFYNFLCSVQANSISLSYVMERTIVIVTDKQSETIVASNGFMTWYHDIDRNDKVGFKETVVLQLMILNDLIQLNHVVLLHDVDIVWNKDPIPYLMHILHDKHADIQFIYDGAGSVLNTGFMFIESNCKTKIFMETMMSLFGLIFSDSYDKNGQKIDDQILWNMMVNQRLFRQINIAILNKQYFINGNTVNLHHNTTRADLQQEHFVFHASWTANPTEKLHKFYNINHFYFTKKKCPKYFDVDIAPN